MEPTIFIGTYNELQFDIGDNDDVSGSDISFYVAKGFKREFLLTKTSSDGIDMTDASTGSIYVEITVADTKTLGEGTFDIELRFEIDSKPEIWYQDKLIIKPAIYVP